jgi:integrase/recombinase XerD
MSLKQDDRVLVKFEEFLTMSAFSSSTIVNYMADLRTFLRWGHQAGGEKFSLLEVTQEHIRLYRYYLTSEQNRAASTVNRHLMSLRKFFSIIYKMGDIALNPTEGVSLVSDNRDINSRVLNSAEIEKLLLAAQTGTRAGLIRRDTAVLQLLLYTGIRVSEIVELKTDDLVFDNPGVNLRVTSGRNHDDVRHLPLPGQTYKILHQYLQVRPQHGSDHLFLSQHGHSISSRTVQRIVNSCARSAKLEDVSPQILRRTFAHQLFTQTASLELVSKRLGHQNHSITEQFLNLR